MFAAKAVCYIRNKYVMMKSVNESDKKMKKKDEKDLIQALNWQKTSDCAHEDMRM